MTYQYLHISFLLSGRNAFYLLNTGLVLAFNAVLAYALIAHFGAIGAAWSRLAADLFGFSGALLLTRWAFPVPMSCRRLGRVLVAAIAMALVVRGVDLTLAVTDRFALAILMPTGIASYLILCWLLDVAKSREHLSRAVVMARNMLSHKVRGS
jgi:O-antigen/teichoic acid export membrane protein